MTHPANAFLQSEPERTVAGFVYNLSQYKHERLLSFVPIHAGDTVTCKLSNGELIQRAVVKQVHHCYSIACASGQTLEASIEFEK